MHQFPPPPPPPVPPIPGRIGIWSTTVSEGRVSSVGRASDLLSQARDAGSSAQCNVGLFSAGTCSQTRLQCPHSPCVQSHASTFVRTGEKWQTLALDNPKHWHPCHCLDTRKYYTQREREREGGGGGGGGAAF